MHVHVGFVSTLITWAQVLLLLFATRWVAAMWPDSSIGKAAAALN
jgi:hypothetical protein